MSDRDLQHSFDTFGESVAEYAFSKCRDALVLERDRHDAEIAELRDELYQVSQAVSRLAASVHNLQHDRIVGHSVRVPE